MELRFTADEDGERLDVFLARKNPDLSRSHIQKLIAAGFVEVEGGKKRMRLSVGTEISMILPEPESMTAKPEDIPLDILYEDGDLIVVNKARGMAVHPSPGIPGGTLVNALLCHCRDLSGINGTLRPGIVHRLDKDTTGVMLAAKNDAAHIRLSDEIRDKEAKRIYLALVTGVIPENDGLIRAPIGRSPKDRQKMAVVDKNGKDAVTRFTVLCRFNGYTFVACRLMTGRTHQIRVHMAHIGHPVVSDPKYGTRRKDFDLGGQALHSFVLSFFHPTTGEEMIFTAQPPPDIIKAIEKISDENIKWHEIKKACEALRLADDVAL